ncbi:hypothetical protein Hanom_Chr07g00615931 [Helianthus anomalus]
MIRVKGKLFVFSCALYLVHCALSVFSTHWQITIPIGYAYLYYYNKHIQGIGMVICQCVENTLNAQCTRYKAQENTNNLPFTRIIINRPFFSLFSHGSPSGRLIFSSHGSTFPFPSLSQLTHLTKLH